MVCVDESPRQLIGEVRTDDAGGARDAPHVRDYEYRRNGTANVCLAVDAHRAWRERESDDAPGGGGLRRVDGDLVDGRYAGL